MAQAFESVVAMYRQWRGLGKRQSILKIRNSEHTGPMSRTDDHIHESAPQRLVVRVTDNDFQREVLEKLSRLEVKMDMLAGGAQPGRMSLAEEKIRQLERNDIRRSVYDRLVNAVITTAISALISTHGRWWK
jgi:hypothetical protein